MVCRVPEQATLAEDLHRLALPGVKIPLLPRQPPLPNKRALLHCLPMSQRVTLLGLCGLLRHLLALLLGPNDHQHALQMQRLLFLQFQRAHHLLLLLQVQLLP